MAFSYCGEFEVPEASFNLWKIHVVGDKERRIPKLGWEQVYRAFKRQFPPLNENINYTRKHLGHWGPFIVS